MGTNLVYKKDLEVEGRPAIEFRGKVQAKANLVTTITWIVDGNDLYEITALLMPRDLEAGAYDYFKNSFHFE